MFSSLCGSFSFYDNILSRDVFFNFGKLSFLFPHGIILQHIKIKILVSPTYLFLLVPKPQCPVQKGSAKSQNQLLRLLRSSEFWSCTLAFQPLWVYFYRQSLSRLDYCSPYADVSAAEAICRFILAPISGIQPQSCKSSLTYMPAFLPELLLYKLTGALRCNKLQNLDIQDCWVM